MPEIKFLLLTCNRSGYCWTMEISVDSIHQALSETSVKHSSKEDASLVLPRSAIRLALSDQFCFGLKQSLTVFLVGGKMRFISWSKSEQCIFHPRLNNVTIRAFIRTDQVRKSCTGGDVYKTSPSKCALTLKIQAICELNILQGQKWKIGLQI